MDGFTVSALVDICDADSKHFIVQGTSENKSFQLIYIGLSAEVVPPEPPNALSVLERKPVLLLEPPAAPPARGSRPRRKVRREGR